MLVVVLLKLAVCWYIIVIIMKIGKGKQLAGKSASGKTVTEIAKELSLSVNTVSTYRSRILDKMKMKSNPELTHYAIKNQLVE